MSWAIGFSLQTALPARSAASISAAWVLVGVTITTASTAGSWIASSGSPDARSARASSRPVAAASASGSATTTTRAFGMAAMLRRWVRPIRPAPRTATPIAAGSLGAEGHSSSRRWSARPLLVPVARLVHVVLAADLGHGHVPPALHARHAARGRRRARRRPWAGRGREPRPARRGSRPACRASHGDRAHRRGVLPEVDRDVGARQPVAGGIAEAQLVAEVADPAVAGEIEDALVAVVVEHDAR